MMNYFDFFTTNSDYGSSRTRSFSNIFPDFETFQSAWVETTFSQQAIALNQDIPEQGEQGISNLRLVYELLLARYANSTIASSDESRFVLQCMSTIFQHAPTYIKRLEIQHTLHEMDLKSENFLHGAAQIYNTSLNPSESPSTDSFDPLSTINQQNVNLQKRDKFKALAMLEELLRADITEDFVNKFKYLFRTIVAPQRPLFYTTQIEED